MVRQRFSTRRWSGLLVLALAMQSAAAYFFTQAIEGAPRDRWVLFVTFQVAAALVSAIVVVERPPRAEESAAGDAGGGPEAGPRGVSERRGA